MPTFSLRSKERLATCHPDLRAVCEELIKYIDFSVLCGHRRKAEQEQAVADGKSRAVWPTSAHNKLPSLAVDIAPYPLDWKDIGSFKQLYGAFTVVARQLKEQGKIKHTFVWGGNWRKLKDYPHYEIKEK